jgi:hypothetical protein
MDKQQSIKSYYAEICKREGMTPLPIKFESVGRGGAKVTYVVGLNRPIALHFDLKRCIDLEYGLLHEVAHQILLTTKGDPAQKHNAAFRKIEAKMLDKYMYSDLTFKYKL